MKKIQLPPAQSRDDFIRIASYFWRKTQEQGKVFILNRLPLSLDEGTKKNKTKSIKIYLSSKMTTQKIIHLRDCGEEKVFYAYHSFQENNLSKREKVAGYEIDVIYTPFTGIVNILGKEEQWLPLIEEGREIFTHDHHQLQFGNHPILPAPPSDDLNTANLTKKEFCEKVDHSIQQIHQDKFQKVILSRVVTKRWKTKPNLTGMLDKWLQMGDAYPLSLLHLVADSQQKSHIWMGASPEILVELKNHIFSTVSLAGTKTIDPNQSVASIGWNQKEIEEQAYVSRYIIDCFKKLRHREYVETGPLTVQTGNLVHLKSIFTTNIKKYYGPALPYEMLKLLHPTSAICGSPKKAALDWILQQEPHKRHFYCGFLGPIGEKKSIHLYVNLRCAALNQTTYHLYGGGGITAQSQSNAEWVETSNKIQGLETILQG